MAEHNRDSVLFIWSFKNLKSIVRHFVHFFYIYKFYSQLHDNIIIFQLFWKRYFWIGLVIYRPITKHLSKLPGWKSSFHFWSPHPLLPPVPCWPWTCIPLLILSPLPVSRGANHLLQLEVCKACCRLGLVRPWIKDSVEVKVTIRLAAPSCSQSIHTLRPDPPFLTWPRPIHLCLVGSFLPHTTCPFLWLNFR